MRIALVSTRYTPEEGGGIGTYCQLLAEGLVAQGHSVTLICWSSHPDKSEMLNGVSVHRYSYRHMPLVEKWCPGLKWSWQVAKVLDELGGAQGWDLIEFPNWEGVGHKYLRRSRRAPSVLRLHTPFFESLTVRKNEQITAADRFVCRLEKQAVLAGDGLTASTRAHAAIICEEYKISPDQIQILPLGIRLPTWTAPAAPGADKEVKILYVSRLEQRKGSLTMLDAIPEILRRYPNCRFSLLGRDNSTKAPGGRNFRDYFTQTHPELAGKVEFRGHVTDEELQKYYRECDLMAVPSNYESFGLIYVEAMAYGKPVIGCRVGGIPEVIGTDEKAGYLITPGDSAALTEKIVGLAGNPALRHEMGLAARRRTETYFSQETMVKRTLEFYQETLRRKSAGKK